MTKERILNLFSGIGGNRELWGNRFHVTAIENDEERANIYKKRFPNDKVIIQDAYEYFEDHFHEFKILWSSNPCVTHTILMNGIVGGKYSNAFNYKVRLPDMRLYGMILFCKKMYRGNWIIENVNPYYKPLIRPTSIRGRHLYWSNCYIPDKKKDKIEVGSQGNFNNDNERMAKDKNIDLTLFGNMKHEKIAQTLKDLIDPKEGLFLLKCLLRNRKKQTILSMIERETEEGDSR